ncbi:MAG: translation elongation factor Ts [Patescibacteria group bacterium]|jgi:elongation factor Ts
MSSLEKIQKLREATGLGVMELKKALEETGGDEAKTLEILKEKGVAMAEKRAERATSNGVVVSYVHAGRIGALVELNCETDFVARTDDFQAFAKELAMQIASMNPLDLNTLLDQAYIKDANTTIQDLLTQIIAKTGENIRIGQFSRIELGGN